MNECVNVCVCMVPYGPIQGVFSPPAQCSHGKFWIQCNPDQNKEVIEDE